ncbi:hypothetical protein E2C01_044927 [Portunus trituberculatus]|uniref:Uncharacterized protein n=1 Tax=Portunus trituberculatus TaxID=210409 RepID=A0A5B7G0R5_PORTR|nr:hypothetical protein [Portunus trituberculatus]
MTYLKTKCGGGHDKDAIAVSLHPHPSHPGRTPSNLIVHLRVVVATSPSLVPSVYHGSKRPTASPAGGDTPDTSGQPQRALTAAYFSECMDLLVQSMKILEEIDANIERSTAVIRGVMEKIMCYEVLLKKNNKRKKQ